MRKTRRILVLLLAALVLLPVLTFAAEDNGGAPDYGLAESWAYFALGEDTGVDVFLICPTVDTRSERNSFDLNDKLKGRFVSALDMEKGIYEDAGRLYSPYYRQMSMNAYKLSPEERKEAQAVAYSDVSAAFRWYMNHENGGRGLILAGFSQGAQMCLELLKEFYGGDSAEAVSRRANLVTVYAIGWSVTEEMVSAYPQIVPAAGETDVGSVVCFDCEDGSLTETLVIPAGMRALFIVAGYSDDSDEETEFLSEVASKVTYFKAAGSEEKKFADNVSVISEKPLKLEREGKTVRLFTDKGQYDADGVFILRESVSPGQLVPGLATEGSHIKVDRELKTSIKGLFACGDIAGKPYQYIKSAGEGNVAALSAVSYLAGLKE